MRCLGSKLPCRTHLEANVYDIGVHGPSGLDRYPVSVWLGFALFVQCMWGDCPGHSGTEFIEALPRSIDLGIN